MTSPRDDGERTLALISLANDLDRRADACTDTRLLQTDKSDRMRLAGKCAAYRHAAEMVRAEINRKAGK